MYKTKQVFAGNLIQYYVYDKPISNNFKSDREDYQQAENGEKRRDSLQRTRNNVALTIECNLTQYSKFITLTTEQPIYDRDLILHYFSLFRKKIKRKFKIDLPYLAVIEKQYKRQVKYNLPEAPLHLHIILFHDKYLPFDDLKAMWCKYGSLDIKRVRTEDLSVYLMKYITKEMIDFKKNSIFKSQGLKMPLVLFSSIDETLPGFTYHTTYSFYSTEEENAIIPNNSCTMYELRAVPKWIKPPLPTP